MIDALYFLRVEFFQKKANIELAINQVHKPASHLLQSCPHWTRTPVKQ